MNNFFSDWYLWIKSLHIFFVVAWMAGLFYLPRLFSYHAVAKPGSELDKTFQVMERRLLHIIMNPAMFLSWGLGLLLLSASEINYEMWWLRLKLIAVLALTLYHHLLGSWRKDFELGNNTRSQRFYRLVNEIPTVLFLIIIAMVIVKPF